MSDSEVNDSEVAIVPRARTLPAVELPVGAERVLRAYFANRRPNTIKSYGLDLKAFASFVGVDSIGEATEVLLSHSQGAANLLALDFREHLSQRGLAASSVNRALASLRSLTKVGRMVGRVPWALEVPRLRQLEPYRDTRGPGRDGFRALVTKLEQRDDAKGRRDLAFIRLLYERGLRKSETLDLDVSDVSFDRSAVYILGKMRAAKEWHTIPATTLDAIDDWLELRGAEPGPLFCRVTKWGTVLPTARLTPQGGYRVVRRLGESISIRARPHGLRHAAITEAIDRGQPLPSVQKFSRHRNLNMLMTYYDNLTDLGGKVADAISEPSESRRPRQRGPRPVNTAMPTEPVNSAHRAALKLGERSPNAKITADQVLELCRRATAGESIASLARAYRLSRANVTLIIRGRSWRHIKRDPVPAQPLGRRLIASEVLEIRRRCAAGETRRAVAKAFDVSPNTVGNIVARLTWRRLPALEAPPVQGEGASR